MFTEVYKWGQHTVYDSLFLSEFIKYIEDLYEGDDLNTTEYNGKNDFETKFHKKFYRDIKTNYAFKNLYLGLIEQIYTEFFKDEKYLIYQTFPSIRFQFPGTVAVPPHCDSDEIGQHPIGEKNFLISITEMKDNRRLVIESEPNKADFKGIDLEPGQMLYFNGNKCIHYNHTNIDNKLRISFDFRIILPKDYLNYIENYKISVTKPRDENATRLPMKMIIGGYYQTTLSKDFVNFRQIEQSRPLFGKEEADSMNKYLTTGDPFITEYKETQKLENMICKYIGVKNCIMTTSGTTALIVALMATGIEPGHRVIVPSYTMVATLNAVKIIGAIPVLLDVSKETYTLELDEIKRHENIKAVIHVSINNRDSNIFNISRYCKQNGIILIEDAAQSLGSDKYGHYGDVACFSLSTPKIISTGQGGFIVTDNDDLARNIRIIKNFGRRPGTTEEYIMTGLNFKFTDIQAVIGIEQMKKLPERVQRYKDIYTRYSKYINLRPVNCIPWFIDYESNNRDRLSKFLNIHGIDTRPCYPALANFQNTNFISNNGVFLPTHMNLTDSDIDFIGTIITCFEKLFPNFHIYNYNSQI
jgi:perosamine synthetase